MSESVQEEKVLTPGRRVFLKGALGLTGLLVLDGWRALDQQASQEDRDEQGQEQLDEHASRQTEGEFQNPLAGVIASQDERLREDTESVSDTIAESLIATGATMGYSLVANNDLVRLYSGNSGTKEIREKYKQQKLRTAIKIVGATPVIEETIFRGAPAMFGGTESMLPVRGIISTYLFGKIHQFSTRKKTDSLTGEEKDEIFLNKNKIPVPQYALGAFYWMVARRRGLKHSMIGHATTNMVGLAAIEVASRVDKTGPEEVIGKE